MRRERIKYKKTENKFLFFLLFIFIIFNSVSNSYSLDISHPPNTELAERGTRQYRSLLTQDKILKFYRQELTREGWRQVNAPLQQAYGVNSLNRTFNFGKGSDTLVLTFSPFTAEGFVFYTIDIGSLSEVGDLAGDENSSLDNAPKEPEPLDFMPIFPGSKQVDRRRSSSGSHIGYMVSGEIDEVKEFYLEGMPGYGWNFVGQENIGGKGYDLAGIGSTCPTCPKMPLQIEEPLANVETTGVVLEFKNGDKTCSVAVSKIGNFSLSEARHLTSVGLGDIIITVIYNDKN